MAANLISHVKPASRANSHRRRVGLIMLAFAAGLATVWSLGKAPYVGERIGAPQAIAGENASSTGIVFPGDARINWVPLPTGLVSNVVADGNHAWVGVVEEIGAEGVPNSQLLRIDSDGTTSILARFTGRPTRVSVNADEVVVAAGLELLWFDRATGRQLARVSVASVAGEARFVSSLVAGQRSAFVALDGQSTVLEVSATDGVRVVANVGSIIPTPETLVLLGGMESLIASTPFGNVGGAEPGTVRIDIASGEVERIELGRPFSFAVTTDGALVTTQSVPRGGLKVMSPDDRASWELPSGIPWNGQWDLLTTDGRTTWGAVAGSGRLFREVQGVVEPLELPRFSAIPSLPRGTVLSELENEQLKSLPTEVSSLAGFEDGGVVAVTSGAGSRLAIVGSN